MYFLDLRIMRSDNICLLTSFVCHAVYTYQIVISMELPGDVTISIP